MRTIILLVMMTSPQLGQEGERPCAVTLRVVNAAGLPQPYSVTAFKDDNGVDYADRFQGLRATVPCRPGLYAYQVKWNVCVRGTPLDVDSAALGRPGRGGELAHLR